MCTVTYLPISDDAFLLSSNRDESKLRSAYQPRIEEKKDYQLLYPQDPKAGGTWICVSSNGKLVCLLNGAFENHSRKPPYRRSRGLVVKDYFEYRNFSHFINDYNFKGIEPFTMVIYDNGQLFELRWNASVKFVRYLDKQQPYIWSSSTLYTKEWRTQRANWFKEWLKEKKEYQQNEIIEFHKHGGKSDAHNGFIMNRNNIVQTISISSINMNKQKAELKHIDLLNPNNTTQTTLKIKTRRGAPMCAPFQSRTQNP